MAKGPSRTECNGDRDGTGRFTAGNKAAKGNPFARRMARLRSVLLDSVTDEDLRTVSAKLIDLAKGGDLAAVKLLLAYSVGKPDVPVDPDTVCDDGFALDLRRSKAASDAAMARILDPSLGTVGYYDEPDEDQPE